MTNTSTKDHTTAKCYNTYCKNENNYNNEKQIIINICIKMEELNEIIEQINELHVRITQLNERLDALNIQLLECPICYEKKSGFLFESKFDCNHRCCKSCYINMKAHDYEICPICRNSNQII